MKRTKEVWTQRSRRRYDRPGKLPVDDERDGLGGVVAEEVEVEGQGDRSRPD